MKDVIYLDHAAATPMDKRVLSAMQPYFSGEFYNPSALYLAAKDVAGNISSARAGVAKWLGARPAEIVFTAGGTEANNLAIHGVMLKFPKCNIVVSGIEHESVLEPAYRYPNKVAPVQADGRVDIDRLSQLIDDQTVLVSVMYANNEVGTIQPLRQLAQVIKSKVQSRKSKGINLPLYLHADACQAANYLDLHVARLGVDMMTLNGGKIYGPKQSGALYVKAGVELEPQILGGGQERGIRSGTENVAGIIGFAKALDLVQERRIKENRRLQKLQQLFIGELEKNIPNIQINGSPKHRLPNNVHITIPGTDNERLIMALDEARIQAAAGSACAASSDEPSHVLKAIGLTDTQAQASLRFTMGRSTNNNAVKKAVRKVTEIL